MKPWGFKFFIEILRAGNSVQRLELQIAVKYKDKWSSDGKKNQKIQDCQWQSLFLVETLRIDFIHPVLCSCHTVAVHSGKTRIAMIFCQTLYQLYATRGVSQLCDSYSDKPLDQARCAFVSSSAADAYEETQTSMSGVISAVRRL